MSYFPAAFIMILRYQIILRLLSEGYVTVSIFFLEKTIANCPKEAYFAGLHEIAIL